MEIIGKIIVACEPRGGVSKTTGNPWKVQEYIIETHEQYPKKCAFEVFGEDRLQQFNIQVGDELKVSFDIDASEFNGRWYNRLRAWRVERVDPNAIAPVAPAPAPGSVPAPTTAPVENADDSGNLPF